MAQFKFRDYSLTLEFPGTEFIITCNSDIGDLIKNMHVKFDALHEEYKTGKSTNQDVLDYVLESIDQILGAGAAAKIFESRIITLSDASDVLVFITNEVTDFIKKMAQGSTNRSQRRAAAKE